VHPVLNHFPPKITQNSKTNASKEGMSGTALTGRPISARVENIVRLTEEYHYKGSHMNMSLLELKEVVDSKKKLYWKLKREMDCCSDHFKGNSNALKSISVIPLNPNPETRILVRARSRTDTSPSKSIKS
jgi:hypothetical protein